jgi:cell wall-associated NlpC family hydrolase
MKNIFIAVLRPVVKGLYRLIKTNQRLCKNISGYVHFSTHKTQTSVTSRYGRSKSIPFWKNRLVIITVGAAAVVLAVVLSIALPRPNNIAEAAMLDAISATVSQISTVAPEPSVLNEQPATTDIQTNVLTKTELNLQNTSSVESLPIAAPDATPVATATPDKPDLVPGCTDSRIIDVQTRLMELGYMGEDEPTEYYGYGTEYALQLFQRKHGLQVDGLLGEKTMSALFSEDAKPYTVKLGDKGTDVEGIQERLHELKYLSSAGTGYFGTDTETAVKSFQKCNSLVADGSVGDNTLEVLYSDDAKPAKTASSSDNNKKDSKDTKKDTKSDTKTDTKKDDTKTDTKKDSGNDDKTAEPAAPDEASADALIEFAKTQLGKKYVHGGKGPNGFDCSGFVYYSLNQVGYKIKYMTSAGWAKSSLPKVSRMSDLKKGDIICFKGHVGIYMGDGNMIDASSSQGKIRISKNIFNSSYWKKTFICGRRVF